MDLDSAMLVLARLCARESPAADLTETVRAAMLAAMGGKLPSGLPPAEATGLMAWLDQARSGQTDPAGGLYQQMLGRSVGRDASGVPVIRHQRQLHRATGAYYTGDLVVRYLLDRVAEFAPSATSLIDPACGAGAFLKGASRCVSHLVGLDADPVALALCRERVPEAALYGVDALLDPFPGGFDLVVGNPPYISSGLRGAPEFEAERQSLLRQRYPETAQYKINTYPLFIQRGLELLRDGGVLGFILPDSFLSGRYFAGIRTLLLSQTILELTLIREDFWKHGRVGQSVILIVRKAAAPDGHKVRVNILDRVAELEHPGGADVRLADLVWGPLRRFRLLPDPAAAAWVRQMESLPGSRPLGEFLNTYSGLIARKGQESFLCSANPGLAAPRGRLLRSGREIDRYRLQWAGEEVWLDPSLIKSGGHLPYYRNPKLLLRQTSDCLRAVYDDQGYYCLNNIHLLLPRHDGVDLQSLLAVLNAGPVDRYYRALTMETGRLYAQVDLDLLETIPVPPLAPETAAQLAALAQARKRAASGEAAGLDRKIDDLVARLYGLG